MRAESQQSQPNQRVGTSATPSADEAVDASDSVVGALPVGGGTAYAAGGFEGRSFPGSAAEAALQNSPAFIEWQEAREANIVELAQAFLPFAEHTQIGSEFVPIGTGLGLSVEGGYRDVVADLLRTGLAAGAAAASAPTDPGGEPVAIDPGVALDAFRSVIDRARTLLPHLPVEGQDGALSDQLKSMIDKAERFAETVQVDKGKVLTAEDGARLERFVSFADAALAWMDGDGDASTTGSLAGEMRDALPAAALAQVPSLAPADARVREVLSRWQAQQANESGQEANVAEHPIAAAVLGPMPADKTAADGEMADAFSRVVEVATDVLAPFANAETAEVITKPAAVQATPTTDQPAAPAQDTAAVETKPVVREPEADDAPPAEQAGPSDDAASVETKPVVREPAADNAAGPDAPSAEPEAPEAGAAPTEQGDAAEPAAPAEPGAPTEPGAQTDPGATTDPEAPASTRPPSVGAEWQEERNRLVEQARARYQADLKRAMQDLGSGFYVQTDVGEGGGDSASYQFDYRAFEDAWFKTPTEEMTALAAHHGVDQVTLHSADGGDYYARIIRGNEIRAVDGIPPPGFAMGTQEELDQVDALLDSEQGQIAVMLGGDEPVPEPGPHDSAARLQVNRLGWERYEQLRRYEKGLEKVQADYAAASAAARADTSKTGPGWVDRPPATEGPPEGVPGSPPQGEPTSEAQGVPASPQVPGQTTANEQPGTCSPGPSLRRRHHRATGFGTEWFDIRRSRRARAEVVSRSRLLPRFAASGSAPSCPV